MTYYKRGRKVFHICEHCGLFITNRMPSAKYHKECRRIKNNIKQREQKNAMQRKNKKR